MEQVNQDIQQAIISIASKHQMEASSVASLASGVVSRYKDRMHSWVSFMFFPDQLSPKRIPELYGLPSHIFKRTGSYVIKADAVGSINIVWAPRITPYYPYLAYNLKDPGSGQDSIQDTQTVSGPAVATEGVLHSPIWGSANDVVVATGGDGQPTILNSDTKSGSFLGIGSPPDGFGINTIRLIGASLEAQYIGTLENLSGIIDVGCLQEQLGGSGFSNAITHVNSFDGRLKVQRHSVSNIQNQHYYRKNHMSDGCRMVWFPLNEKDMEYGFANVDSTTNRTLPDTIPEMAHAIHSHGSFLQWNMIMSGLQANQAVRIDYCYYYEGQPDETVYSNYMPVRASTSSSKQDALVQVREVADRLVVTPSKSQGGWASNLLGNIWGNAKQLAGSVLPKFISSMAPKLMTLGGGAIGTLLGGPGGGVVGANIGGFLGGQVPQGQQQQSIQAGPRRMAITPY